ncbi:uncharacterized protein LOC128275664 [Anopheles cruzii]|uniref:uncharacterized protein LOC128275664 n=1 Tax=Anopheles cruzii TaxID=68878 RepID=UPI0022EC824F|nr:uncharacterized protein LOC128275664 [Anopheles cruzii]
MIAFDLRTPIAHQHLPESCRQSLEKILPTYVNIKRFLDQFVDNGLEVQAQAALKDAFATMLQNGEEMMREELRDPDNIASPPHISIPHAIPVDIRREILRNMLYGHHFRPTPMLRMQLQSYRNQLMRARNFPAAYWIDRLLAV